MGEYSTQELLIINSGVPTAKSRSKIVLPQTVTPGSVGSFVLSEVGNFLADG